MVYRKSLVRSPNTGELAAPGVQHLGAPTRPQVRALDTVKEALR